MKYDKLAFNFTLLITGKESLDNWKLIHCAWEKTFFHIYYVHDKP